MDMIWVVMWLITWRWGASVIKLSIVFLILQSFLLSEPIELMGLLYDLEGITHDDHEKVHHHWHREEDPGEHEECTKHSIELHDLLEGVWNFITEHYTEETEVCYAWVTESEGGPEHCKAEHAETNEEG